MPVTVMPAKVGYPGHIALASLKHEGDAGIPLLVRRIS